MIEASVADNGRGIPQAVLEEIHASSGLAGGVGLPGMHERIGLLGGTLHIRSDRNGTSLTALIPMENQPVAQGQVISQMTEPPLC